METIADKYCLLVNSMTQGFCIIEVLWQDDKAVDYRFLEINKAFERQTGIENAIGKTMRQIEPFHEDHWFELYGEVAKTGKSVQTEAVAAQLHRWYEVNAFPIAGEKNLVAILFNDISERKIGEQLSKEFTIQLEYQVAERTLALQESRELLKTTLDSANHLTEVLQAVRNEQHEIVDFRWIFINRLAERMLGKVIGRYLRKVNDNSIDFDRYVWVTETGNSVMFEQLLTIDNAQRWYDINLVKLNDGIVVKGIDITERKEAELNLKQNNQLLQSIFDTSLIGMAVLEAIRDKQKNRIIDFKIKVVNKKLEDETQRTDLIGKNYLKEYPFVKQAGLFDVMLRVMKTGKAEQLEYHVNDGKWDAWFTFMFVKMDDGLVVTNLDITQRKLAEKKIREDDERLKELEKRQRQELFMATLKTQEEERTRIAENLHNGLGQLLYSVKLSLDQLKVGTNNRSNQAILQAERLLIDAIRESRRISHELMPTILEDFGLQTAIQDICDQFNKTIHFNCHFIGDEEKLDKYTKIAIYRMVQELIMNIIKHAHADEASVAIELSRAYVDITIKDNGKGFKSETTKKKEKGIGINTIQNKIKLLNGTFEIATAKNKGTQIYIRFPNKDVTESIELHK
ncbi:hypothetical protein GCM10023231_01980 [Olivibacter ginsenosidimutans]|uniref:Histidine kinase domain-containing protein n=1 Tax=Olivibacter ginsenosidimutans TaxID=1176537 RepID=A0ABP9ACG4_9SPHI